MQLWFTSPTNPPCCCSNRVILLSSICLHVYWVPVCKNYVEAYCLFLLAPFPIRSRKATWEPPPGSEQQQPTLQQSTGPSPCVRLSFAGCSTEVFAEGIERLAAVVRSALSRQKGAE